MTRHLTRDSFLRSPVCQKLTNIVVQEILPLYAIDAMKDLMLLEMWDDTDTLKPELLYGMYVKSSNHIPSSDMIETGGRN